jgi:hypothetical protein
VEAVAQSTYQELCKDLLNLLHGGESPQLEKLRARMAALADEWRFEDAAKLKEQLQAIEMVAARLRRLQRMREENNVIITQPALREASALLEATPDDTNVEVCNQSTSSVLASVFLVRGGVVRRHLLVRDDEACWKELKREVQELYTAPPPSAPFTAKAELDEMMILDRWLQSHGPEGCCAWMNEKVSRLWATNAVRKVQKWARMTCGS